MWLTDEFAALRAIAECRFGNGWGMGGRLITEPLPEMVLVFQDCAHSLFPWLTVEGNAW